MPITFGLVVDFGSGLLFLALGIAVALVRPARPVTRAFAAFATLFGLDFTLSNASMLLDLPEPLRYAPAILDFGAGTALAVVAVRVRPLGDGARRLRLALALLLGVAAAVAWTSATLALLPAGPWIAAAVAGRTFLVGGIFPAVILLTAEGYLYASSQEARARLAFLATALAFYPMFQLGLQIGLYSDLVFASFLAVAFLLTAVWLALSWIVPGPGFLARLAGFAQGGSACLGILATTAMGDYFATVDSGVNGLVRVMAVAAIAYAILRHQLFDLDVKVKWTLRRGTVAAIFVGLFFVVSESAATFLSTQIGTYLGIAAAGMLLFALAPVQRLADRLAEAAMPNVAEGDEGYLAAKKRQAYRSALEVAWADGTLDPREARHLRELREALQLSHEECDAIERERLDLAAGA